MTIGSLEIDETTGQLKITYGDKLLATGDSGNLVNLSQETLEVEDYAFTFPDPDKSFVYTWNGTQNYTAGGFDDPWTYAQTQSARVFFTRLTGNYEARTKLIDLPDGVDFVGGLVKMTRTTAPNQTWSGRTIAPLQPQGDWIPWFGSGIMEAAPGLFRIMHIVDEPVDPVSDPTGPRGLYIIAEQTVGKSVGFNLSWGDGSNPWLNGEDTAGGVKQNGPAGPGFAVWAGSSPTYQNSISRTTQSTINPNSTPYNSLKYEGSGQLSTTDPTDYTSVYSLDLKIRFGRRS